MISTELDLWQLALVVGVGVVAGVMNVTAVGGSLLMIPVLIFLGLPAPIANATGRVAILLQNIVAVGQFRRHKILVWKDAWPFLLPAVLGALLGSYLAVEVTPALLELLFAIVLLLMAGLLWLRPSDSLASSVGEKPSWLLWLAFFAIGLFGGFIQAGVGILLLGALVGLGGMDLLRANAVKVAIVGGYTVFVLALFLAHGLVDLSVGLILACGNMLGAALGVRISVWKGNGILRIFLLVAVLLCSARLLWKSIYVFL